MKYILHYSLFISSLNNTCYVKIELLFTKTFVTLVLNFNLGQSNENFNLRQYLTFKLLIDNLVEYHTAPFVYKRNHNIFTKSSIGKFSYF